MSYIKYNQPIVFIKTALSNHTIQSGHCPLKARNLRHRGRQHLKNHGVVLNLFITRVHVWQLNAYVDFGDERVKAVTYMYSVTDNHYML